MNDDHTFVVWLRQARANRDLTQEALAEIVGCSTQTVRAFESGRRRPSREMAVRLAEILQVAPERRDAFIRAARTPLDAERAALPVVVPSLAPNAAPPLPRAPARPMVALPADPLIGRHADLLRLRHALLDERRRMVTLLGTGGIGKTRLALQAAADLAEAFNDNIAYVALAPVTNVIDVVTAIAEAVGCPLLNRQSPEAVLITFLRDQTLLLVLDNLEHLLVPPAGDQIGGLLANILRDAPDVRLLITSRERLRLRQEWVIELDGLALPSDDRAFVIERSDAVLLFLERARQVADDFTLTSENRSAVARICRLLGGVPLGVELAATWVRVLSCDEIAAEIERSIDFLARADRDLPPRHRSLRAVIDHSWQLLTNAEQLLLTRLSVFHGGGAREAITAVIQPVAGTSTPRSSAQSGREVLHTLAALVDKSLVRRTTDADSGTRYDLHELVRQYAAARLAEDSTEATEIQAQHAAYYAAWVAQQETPIKNVHQKTATHALVVERDNVRAAWRWGCQLRDARLLHQMFFTLDWFYEVRGWNSEGMLTFAQGNAALRPLVERGDASNETQTCYWLLVGREGWHALRRDPAFAAARMHEAVTALRTVNLYGGAAHVIKGLAYLRIFAGNYAEAEALLDEALVLADAIHNHWARSVVLVVRGALEVLRSDAATARKHLQTALMTARAQGDPRHISLALNYFGIAALNNGQYDEAERACRECLTIAVGNQDRFQTSLALRSLGSVALSRGDYAESEWLFNEALAIAREIGDRWQEAQALGGLGTLASALGQPARARERHRAAVAAVAAAPAPIALDELASLAVLELDAQPEAALAALTYIQRHPLTRPATRALVEARWLAAQPTLSAAQRAAIDERARAFPPTQPAALLDLFGQ